MIASTFDFGPVPLGTIEDEENQFEAVGSVTFGKRAMLQLTQQASGHLARLADLEPGSVTFVGADGLELTDADYAAIAGVPGLASVDFDNNAVTPEQTALFCRDGMIGLNLGTPAVGDDVMPLIGAVATLEHLVLSRSSVTDAGLSYLRGHAALQSLYLWESRVTASSADVIGSLPALAELHFEGADDAVLEAAARPTLAWAHLRRANVSDAGVVAFGACPELATLAFIDSDLTVDACVALGRLAAAEAIWLTESRVNDAALAQGVAQLRELRMLSLHNATCGDAVAAAAARLPSLETLILSGTSVTDRGLQSLGASRSIASLSVARTSVSDAGVACLATLDSLQDLNTAETAVTDAGRAVLTQLPTPFALG